MALDLSLGSGEDLPELAGEAPLLRWAASIDILPIWTVRDLRGMLELAC